MSISIAILVSGLERRTATAPTLLLVALLSVSACCRSPEGNLRPPGPKTAAFLDADDFAGSFDSRDADTEWGGEAIYFGRIVFTNLDRKIVADVLNAIPSSDLELAQNKSATPDLHPVVLLIGEQTQGSFVMPPGWNLPVGVKYNELILLIPFVQKKGGSKWHNYTVHIFLDDYWPMWVGNMYYGLRKEQALLVDASAGYDVFRKVDHVFHAVFSTSQPWLPDANAEAQLANYQDAKEILAMPVLGTITYFPGDPYVCGYFELDYTNAEVRGIDSKHEFLKEFDGGMAAWTTGGTFDSVPDGAFEIRQARWRMRFPPRQCVF